MKRRRQHVPIGMTLVLPVFLVAVSLVGCKGQPEPDEGRKAKVEPGPKPEVEPKPTPQPPTTCAADPAWVSSPSPADSAAFAPDSNCSFHRWAYQSFLWLTSPAEGGGLVFENFANPKNLFVPEPGAYPGRPAGSDVLMLARVGKSKSTADIEDVFQAGPGNKILVDQNLEPIFYSNHLNEDFWTFIQSNQFNLLANLQKADPALDFTINSIELKASWRVVEKAGKVLVPDADKRFHVVETEIPTVTVDDEGMIVENHDKPVKAKMALIGLHVTGVVKGHPEFIWATFEHVDNAPKCDDISATHPATEPKPNPATGQPWTLYDGKAAKSAANQFDTNNPLGPVNICLAHPQGGGSDDNKQAITQINSSVRELEKGSIWTNYELGGAVWTDGTVPVNNGAFAPDKTTATQLGSLQLANTTLESFTQNDNCFSCHNAGAHEVAPKSGEPSEVNAKQINLSHFVVNFQAVAQSEPSK